MITPIARIIRTRLKIWRSRSFMVAGTNIHIGSSCNFWAPDSITLGNHVYIGRNVQIECNTEIGDFVLIANNVAFVGRNDHDYRALGTPVRYSPWIGKPERSEYRDEKVVVDSDVWIGFGSIVLSGVKIGRGSIVAAGSVVTKDVSPYSIIGGNPARQIGQRFEHSQIDRHETSIAGGVFRFSERGYKYWTVEPGQSVQESSR